MGRMMLCKARPIVDVSFSGSYDPADVTFLLKPSAIESVGVAEKEWLIQSGARHYSEMLSPERVPDDRYLTLYGQALARNAARLHGDIESLTAAIIARPATKEKCVIVSLARAGTPIGVLLKRSLDRAGIVVHHYSISIIRGRGIDLNALKYIHERHGSATSIFVDGWTGKGAIKGELQHSLAARPFGFAPFLAVVADPAGRAELAATTQDYVIPSGLLNGIVSGLVSRSVLTPSLVGADDFHACLFQENLKDHDVSRDFIAAIEHANIDYSRVDAWSVPSAAAARLSSERLIKALAKECNITDVNRIKPGIAEATRAVLRRVPDKVFVNDMADPEIQHLRYLAMQSGVQVVERGLENYRALTVIKDLAGEHE